MVESRKSAHNPAHNGHGVSVPSKAIKERPNLLVNHGVVRDHVNKFSFLIGVWKLSIQQEITRLEVIGLLCKLLDRVAPVEQNAFFAVDIGDLRLARGG